MVYARDVVKKTMFVKYIQIQAFIAGLLLFNPPLDNVGGVALPLPLLASTPLPNPPLSPPLTLATPDVFLECP